MLIINKIGSCKARIFRICENTYLIGTNFRLHVILGEELIGPDPFSKDYNFQAIKVSEVFINGRFDGGKHGNDVSLLHLAQSVVIGSKYWQG